MTLVVNLFAGPGTGKSTTAAGVFSLLKQKHVNCEMALEYAKDKVWEGSTRVLENQIYIFAKQLHRVQRLEDQVDVIITDSPLLLSLIYGHKESESFHKLVREVHFRFENLNYFLNREKPYNPSGRLQTEDGAKDLDVRIKTMLNDQCIPHHEIRANSSAPHRIALDILDDLS